MADTTFTVGTLSDDGWFDDVNDMHYTALAGAKTVAAARTALGMRGAVRQVSSPLMPTKYTVKEWPETMDNSIPQCVQSGGLVFPGVTSLVLTSTITPTNASSRLLVKGCVFVSLPTSEHAIVSLFIGSSYNTGAFSFKSGAAVASVAHYCAAGTVVQIDITHEMAAGVTSALIVDLHVASESGAAWLGGTSSTELFNGESRVSNTLTTWELAP